MTLPMEEEDPPAEVDDDVEQHEDAETSSPSPSKPNSEMTKSALESVADYKDNGADAATVDSSMSKQKSKKKKKKKISRNNDSNSPAMLAVFNEQDDDKSNDGLENRTVVSTTSSKMKSKGTKKKKKKINAADDAESVDIVSVSEKKSPKKKKKKKISRYSNHDESPDVTPDCSARSIATESVKSSSKKSKSTKSMKSPKSKSKKKKVKSVNGSEHTLPEIECSKSLDPILDKSTNGIPRKTMSMEPEQQSNLAIRRSMSLDMANSHLRPGPPMHGGRANVNWGGRGRVYGGRGRGPPVTGRGRGRGRGGLPGGWQSRSMRPPERMQNAEMSFASRSSSHERLPYGNRNSSRELQYGARSLSKERATYGLRNGSNHSRSSSHERAPYGSPRGMGPAPARGRRPMSPHKSPFDGSPPTSSHSHINLYRAPSRPKSILRNSSHHGMLSGSSHHRSIETSSTHSSSQRNNSRRVCMDLNAESRHSTQSYKYDQQSFDSEIDSSDIESDGEDDSSFAMEDSGHRRQKQVPRTVHRGFSRSLSGLGTNSSHHGLSHFKAQGQSMRSLLTIERSEFQNENRFIRTLRYIHFLAPHPNEDPIKKKIRIITWLALFCDFMNAFVAILTWNEETTKCCEQSIFSTLGNQEIDMESDVGSVWDLAVAITTYLYMLLIFLEVVPVMRDRFPFNLMNPFIGFLITFAVFFSDSIIEAVSMWCFEALAVTCEAINYRLRRQRFAQRRARLKNTKKEIEKLRRIKRKVKDQYDNGGGRVLTRGDSAAQFVLDLNDSSSSFAEDSSFNDDIETQNNSADLNTVAGRTAVTAVSNIGTHRETRLLRERRQLIRSQAEDQQDLRIHFIGVACNVFLVVFSMLMIIVIAKNGGMCINGMRMSNPFSNKQLEKCNQCIDDAHFLEDGTCQYCQGDDPTKYQCYYPYGFGA